MNKSEYKIKVVVRFTDGSNAEFFAVSTYSPVGDGHLVCWEYVLVENEELQSYSFPTAGIKSISEKER